MSQADRLFQIIQILRRSSLPITAKDIAAELEVSTRTIYRDIGSLSGRRVPIRGEAGFGYVLEDGFDMPPLTLTPDEVEAAVLGAQWVASRGDPVLAVAAHDLIAKIAAAVSEPLRLLIADPAIGTLPPFNPTSDGIDVARTRIWIREGRKIRIDYRDERGARSRRVIWPIIVSFFEETRILGAWCELRQDFRNFCTDRIETAEFLDDRYTLRRATLRLRWKRAMAEQRQRHSSAL